MHPFTAVFLIAVAVTLATRLWLSRRHIRHVLANRDEVPAEFAASVALSAHQRAAGYTVAKTRLGIWEMLVSVTLLLAFTLGGGLQFLADAWSGVFRPGGYAHGIALVASVAVISGIVDLPFSVYRVFVIEEQFGFNRMTPGLYIADLAKQVTLGAALGLPLLFAVLWLMDRMGTYWWLYVWLAWMVFNLAILAIYPTVIAPLFNKFTPLADESLRERIETLLARCGFRAKGLFVMDGSKRSSHGNAYFTGLGAAKRIVFFDTLMQRLAPQEIEAVLAHELGHFKHRHVVKRIAMVAVMSLLFLAALGYLIGQKWFFTGLGVETPSTALALLLFFMALPAFTFLLHPLASVYSRRHEYEADVYAAHQANAGDLVHALVKLYQDNASTLTPDPVHSAFYDSHPPAALRIARLQAFLRMRPT